MKKYLFLCLLFLPNYSHAAVFYVDFTCATDGIGCGTGTATTTPFASLTQFTAVARNTGDIAFVKRGVASTTNTAGISFTSSGTMELPISLSADYDNLWNDFASSTQTYTLALGTTTFTASANVTGISAGQWVYAQSDCFETYNTKAVNPCLYAYKVDAVNGNQLILQLPYKGQQTGSGITLRVMGSSPQQCTVALDCRILPSSNTGWVIKGIDFRNSTNGAIAPTTSFNFTFIDDSFYIGNTNNVGIFQNSTALDANFSFIKVYGNTQNTTNGFININGSSRAVVGFKVIDSVFFATSSTVGFINTNTGTTNTFAQVEIYDTTAFFAKGNVYYNLGNGTSNITQIVSRDFITNLGLTDSASRLGGGSANLRYSSIRDEDSEGIPGFNTYWDATTGSNWNLISSTTMQSTTTASVLRSGGGPVSTRVVPGFHVGSTSPLYYIKLFDYPINTDTSSKTYTMYFMSTSTAAWGTNPDKNQLWIQCNEWVNQATATSTRAAVRSTGTVNFTGSTAWQSLAVTCAPTQSGKLYLQGFYAKNAEPGKLNEFYFDGTPIIN